MIDRTSYLYLIPAKFDEGKSHLDGMQGGGL